MPLCAREKEPAKGGECFPPLCNDPTLDIALSLRDELLAFLQQGRDETSSFAETVEWLQRIAERAVGRQAA